MLSGIASTPIASARGVPATEYDGPGCEQSWWSAWALPVVTVQPPNVDLTECNDPTAVYVVVESHTFTWYRDRHEAAERAAAVWPAGRWIVWPGAPVDDAEVQRRLEEHLAEPSPAGVV